MIIIDNENTHLNKSLQITNNLLYTITIRNNQFYWLIQSKYIA
jgi:hypothetical protein